MEIVFALSIVVEMDELEELQATASIFALSLCLFDRLYQILSSCSLEQ
jgi:hypothetical protein